MNLNENLKNYLDTEFLKLVEEVSMMEVSVNTEPPVYSGSIIEKKSIDLSDTVPNITFELSDTNYKGGKIDRWIKFPDKEEAIGLDETSYSKLLKLVEKLLQTKEIDSVISAEFIENSLFNLIIESYQKPDSAESILTKLLIQLENSISEEMYCFPILYTEISKPFTMGDIEIKFFTKADFDWLSNNFIKKNTGNTENPYEPLREKYEGQVVICCIVTAEPGKGQDIAFEKCSLALDILKICSDTLDLPDYPLDFDIDSRAKLQSHGTVIMHGPIGVDKFLTSSRALPKHINFEAGLFSRMEERHVRLFTNFLIVKKYNDELSNLIHIAVRSLSEALSVKDLNQRSVLIMSIFDSLILEGQTVGIIDSLKKYVPKLVHSDPDIRTEIKKVLGDFYKIRSEMVHHAKRLPVINQELSKLQNCLRDLLVNLILKRHNENQLTKVSVLKEIDDALNKAG